MLLRPFSISPPPQSAQGALLRATLSQPRRFNSRRFNSYQTPRPQQQQRVAPSEASRLDRTISRLPRSLRKHASHLRNAPGSHVVAFLILHEATAVIPLIGLVGLFHWGLADEDTPMVWVSDRWGGHVREGMARFERYFKRKGYFDLGGETGGQLPKRSDEQVAGQDDNDNDDVSDEVQKWRHAEGGYRIVAEVAVAYAITKALLPVRILASLWATPWFAVVLVRVRNTFTKTKKK